MTLAAGVRLGPYEILGALGAGGMGEVYKARDTRLDRMVAIKVLPSHLSSDPALRSRFEREARAISSLQHPNICTLYDVGHQDGVDFLVMEHLEGETLSERLQKGPLPTDQTLRAGIEIAEALDKAHKSGIVHRDLKPGNIMLTRGGVKLLDFGLAKTAAGPAVPAVADSLSVMATAPGRSQPLTQEGTLLGTFQYMAPEQLEGAEADARTDLFAFGAVLYEMATGRPAFAGKSRASLISAIMSSDPPAISTVQPLTPPAFERLVRALLAKDPNERVQTAHDARLQLQWIAEGGSQLGVPAPLAARRRNRERLAWTVAAVALAPALGLGLTQLLRHREPPRVVRFTVATPEGAMQLGSPRVSPDGRIIATDGIDSTGTHMLWLRRLNALDMRAVPGTEGIWRPFWSPDSRYVGFIADGKLKKIAVDGGPPQVLADVPSDGDGSWGVNGDIVWDGGASDPIRRVPSGGGTPEAVVNSDSGVVGWPEFLPDGRHFLYLRMIARPEIWVADVRTKERHRLGPGGSRMEYSPAGYVLFERDRSLLAQRFDARALKLIGDPFPVAEGVGTGPNGLAHFSVSDEGTLVYTSGSGNRCRLVWVDRSGHPVGSAGDADAYRNPAVSPDGQRIAAAVTDERSNNLDVWVLDLQRGTRTRLTFDPALDNFPQWSPDGATILFGSNRAGGRTTMFSKHANGLGAEEHLSTGSGDELPMDWTRDGKYLVYSHTDSVTQLDVWARPLVGDGKPFPVVATAASEELPRVSPDGRWVVYQSNESGRYEIYVQSFPTASGKWQISNAGGTEPEWSADGRELFYLSADGRVTSVAVQSGAQFGAGTPQPLFPIRVPDTGWYHFRPAPDGKRFLVVTIDDQRSRAPETVVLHWDAEIGKK
ncbi:MAG: protein kinase [Candidatus Eisenbacteria bacterium]